MRSWVGITLLAALPGFAGYGTNVAIDRIQRAQTLESYKLMARASGVAERIVTAAVKSAVAAVPNIAAAIRVCRSPRLVLPAARQAAETATRAKNAPRGQPR